MPQKWLGQDPTAASTDAELIPTTSPHCTRKEGRRVGRREGSRKGRTMDLRQQYGSHLLSIAEQQGGGAIST